ncbi:MAG: nucleotidyltransferase domain-containing protein [Byssovorax sp.]
MTPLQRLAQRLGHAWPHLDAARDESDETRARLTARLVDQVPNDTSLVVFGSLARGELTKGSDLDWTLLVDGRAHEAHHTGAQAIARIFDDEEVKKPGPTGVFGNFAFSHPIVHQIGGQEDTNKNTTQRILLLLESVALGREDVHERVLRLVLSRYVEDDRGLRFSRKAKRIPRFLLNDIVRYWRTVTVDFVYKQRERADGWALRNAKLRMSRKLIFVSGLLTCFAPEMFAEAGETWTGADGYADTLRIVQYLLERTRIPPLQQLAEMALRPAISFETAREIFDAYNDFIGVLADEGKREHLKKLTFEQFNSDQLFKDVQRMTGKFQDGLDKMFFEEDDVLKKLIRDYGVF